MSPPLSIYRRGEEGYAKKAVGRLIDGMFVQQISKHTVTKIDEMFENGYVCGHLPFGFRREYIHPIDHLQPGGPLQPQRAKLEPNDAEIVRRAFNLLSETRIVVRVRDYLNRVSKKKWDTTSTKRLLSDERYMGIAIHGERG